MKEKKGREERKEERGKKTPPFGPHLGEEIRTKSRFRETLFWEIFFFFQGFVDEEEEEEEEEAEEESGHSICFFNFLIFNFFGNWSCPRDLSESVGFHYNLCSKKGRGV